jgi:hypothetical protein
MMNKLIENIVEEKKNKLSLAQFTVTQLIIMLRRKKNRP